jgi:hypothetical protein
MTPNIEDLEMALAVMHLVVSQKLGMEVPPRLIEAMRHVDKKRAQDAATQAVINFCDRVCATKQ